MPSPIVRPAPRIAYDLDGTLGFLPNTVEEFNRWDSDAADRSPNPAFGHVLQLTPEQMSQLNAEAPDYLGVNGSTVWAFDSGVPDNRMHYIALVFPQPMHIQGSFFGNYGVWGWTLNGYSASVDLDLETSWDSTNGTDGTWMPLASKPGGTDSGPFQIGSSTSTEVYTDGRLDGYGWEPHYGGRVRDVRAVRLRFTNPPTRWLTSMHALLHLYGEPEAVKGLQFSEVLADPEYLAWGDVDHEAVETKELHVTNTTVDRLAENVIVSLNSDSETLYGFPETNTALSLSGDGGVTWSSAVTLGDLAPGEESAPILARLDPPLKMFGARYSRIVIDAQGGWS